MNKLFGTDGIRGKANSYPMTAEIALRVGKGVARLYRERDEKEKGNAKKVNTIIIGKDPRLSGYMFENALTAGVLSEGVNVLVTGPIPTPGIAFLAKELNCDAGIMITASHNPAEYNGIKIFTYKGYKLKEYREKQIEEFVFSENTEEEISAENIGRAKRIDDALERYADFLKKSVGGISLSGLKVVMDCANGTTYKIAPKVFSELGAEVRAINVEPDGFNINKECGALFPEKMQSLVVKEKADLGVAFDGDGDRLVVCDEKGNLLDGDELMSIFALDLKAKGKLAKNTLVTTVMSNVGFEEAMQKNGIAVERTQVGDKFVIQKMRDEGFSFGGEQSGHLIFGEFETTGDGILAALQLAKLMVEKKKKLSELNCVMKKFPQVLINVTVSEKRPFDEMKYVEKEIIAAKKTLEGRGRVLVRYSGTENLCRIMVEGKEKEEIQKIAEGIAREIKKEIGV